ncbi:MULTISPECIES: RsmB/NOP family class I SAM-dependent RNA methyltransferase [unclassified Leptolyngbya]|uniref:RsmB/NOP family class I SAM-dependent RNA methyltransferase n=1 Tax=unclassified Leptolyngbya TaxID=2650499 RepID=UPI001684D234|nr:RsmB/NOP family class I SAM-dependent RNA methyltransferase [Leptolyngbya sp. FACHB-8]MBD2153210.1 RsmB/NOP family class I SAM-dependent RNA methyltransferase [Leptolyngbya sp. FACHB-16]
MAAPSNLLLKLSKRLFSEDESRSEFVDALTHPQDYPSCILWCKPRPEEMPFAIAPALSWQPDFVDRVKEDKIGQHPLHQEGHFYSLDLSSVFAASAMGAIATPVRTVFDMCASPGGKSVFAWRMFQPELLLCNEVTNKRIGALVYNLRRCEIRPARVVSVDSNVLAEEIPQIADLVLVDAPCTCQSVLAKGEKAPGCFHPVSINKNANRQKRILANSASLVAPQGHLLYMTCTYSTEENEEVMDWFLERFPEFAPVPVPALQSYQSHLTERPCYRMFPQDGLGAGSFSVLFQNQADGEKQDIPESFFTQRRIITV